MNGCIAEAENVAIDSLPVKLTSHREKKRSYK